MANWSKITNRGNVQDRRGLAPIVGGISLTGLAIIIVFNLITGGSPADVLNQIESLPPSVQNSSQVSQEFAGEDSYEVFASTVLGSNNALWENVFANNGKNYIPPTLVLFRQATDSACGVATSEVGPHYCPLDKIIYLDETFFDELTNRFGATGGDVAEAYVIAHEVGHHIQNELGILDQVQSNPTNESSIQIELMADCLAGVWANSIKDKNVLEPQEIKEAMDAAAAVGDDRIQTKVSGYINPETWTHGSSEDRVNSFTKGYDSGDINSCNSF